MPTEILSRQSPRSPSQVVQIYLRYDGCWPTTCGYHCTKQNWAIKIGRWPSWRTYQALWRPRSFFLASQWPGRQPNWPLPATPSIGQVKAALKRLNPKKATGYDGVPAWFLKHFHEELAPVIHDIICASIFQCKYPTPYKRALVTQCRKSVILST